MRRSSGWPLDPASLLSTLENSPEMGGPVSTPARTLFVARNATRWRLREQALRSSMRRLEKFARAKSQLLADLGHEIRNPLNAIMGFVAMLGVDEDLGAERRSHLRRISAAAEDLLDLAQKLLDAARVEDADVALQDRPFALRGFLEDVLAMAEPSAHSKGLKAALMVTEDAPTIVTGDPGRLRQVLSNLLCNAIKFTPSGAVTMSASCRPDSLGGRRIYISVADTGIGLSAGQVALLFRRFVRIDPLNNGRAAGAGLGLAIAKRLVERMGGTIAVSSTSERGTTFEVSLPFSDVPTAADLSPAVARQLSPAASRSVRATRVLVADDDKACRAVACAMLEHLGCAVEAVADGRAAIAAARSTRFDLILIDQQMPGILGTEAVQAIRAMSAPLGTPPILVCSGGALERDRRALALGGIEFHVAKPLSLGRLAEAVRLALPSHFGSDVVVSARAFPAPEGLWLDPAIVREAISHLRAELSQWVETAPGDQNPVALAKRAHAVLSTASAIGLIGLARRCQNLERAVDRHRGVGAAVKAFRAEAARILDQTASVVSPAASDLARAS